MNDELYRQAILRRYRSPKHRRALAHVDATSTAADPLCGDEMTVSARIEQGRIVDAAFEARGCSISQASADMMIDAVMGATTDEVEELSSSFEAMLRSVPSVETDARLADLEVLSGVRKFPSRVKCALLPWNALRAALESYGGASTPSERAAS